MNDDSIGAWAGQFLAQFTEEANARGLSTRDLMMLLGAMAGNLLANSVGAEVHEACLDLLWINAKQSLESELSRIAAAPKQG